jgi:hypothetical protein
MSEHKNYAYVKIHPSVLTVVYIVIVYLAKVKETLENWV